MRKQVKGMVCRANSKRETQDRLKAWKQIASRKNEVVEMLMGRRFPEAIGVREK